MFIHRNQINVAFLQAISVDVNRKKKTKALEFSTSRTLKILKESRIKRERTNNKGDAIVPDK